MIYYGPSSETTDAETNQESPNKDLSLTKDTTFPELSTSHDDNDSSCSCGGETRDTSVFPKAFDHEILTPIESNELPPSGDKKIGTTSAVVSNNTSNSSAIIQQEGSAVNTSFTMVPNSTNSSGTGQVTQPPLIGDLTPIIESSKLEESSPTSESINLAQTQCDISTAHKIAQNDQNQLKDTSANSDKKRATSVTFDVANESEAPTSASTSVGPVAEGSSETRKQKVFLN